MHALQERGELSKWDSTDQLSRWRQVFQAMVATLSPCVTPKPPQRQGTEPCSLMHLSICGPHHRALYRPCHYHLQDQQCLQRSSRL